MCEKLCFECQGLVWIIDYVHEEEAPPVGGGGMGNGGGGGVSLLDILLLLARGSLLGLGRLPVCLWV